MQIGTASRYFILLLAFWFGADAAAQVKPEAPPRFCVDGKCADLPIGARIKWNPGHYIGTSRRDTLPLEQIAEVVAMKAKAPEVKGIGLWYSWRFLEPTRGNYAPIRASLLPAVEAIHAAGLKVYIFVADDTFSGTTRYAPDYLTSELNGKGGIHNKLAGGTTPKIWVPAIMDRVELLFKELGTVFDSHPAVEMIQYRELDPAMGGAEYASANFTEADYFTQLRQWVVTVKAAFPHTNIAAPANFSGSAGLMAGWVEFCYQNKVGIGGPDIFPQAPYIYGGTTYRVPTWTDRVLRGEKWDGSKWVSGGFDYRGKILIANQVQDPEMGRNYVWPPRAFYEYAVAMDGLAQSHMYWWRKDYEFKDGIATAAETYWSNRTLQPDASKRVKDYLLLGGHPMRATPPSFYEGKVVQ